MLSYSASIFITRYEYIRFHNFLTELNCYEINFLISQLDMNFLPLLSPSSLSPFSLLLHNPHALFQLLIHPYPSTSISLISFPSCQLLSLGWPSSSKTSSLFSSFLNIASQIKEIGDIPPPPPCPLPTSYWFMAQLNILAMREKGPLLLAPTIIFYQQKWLVLRSVVHNIICQCSFLTAQGQP